MISFSTKYDDSFKEDKIRILPWVGSQYDKGLSDGKKVLVVGASKYCLLSDTCDNEKECFNHLPPSGSIRHAFCKHTEEDVIMNNRRDIPAHVPPSHKKNSYPSYLKFANLFLDCSSRNDIDCQRENYGQIWSHIAFVNLISSYVHEIKTSENFHLEKGTISLITLPLTILINSSCKSFGTHHK